MWNWIKKIINKKINDNERKELTKKLNKNIQNYLKVTLKNYRHKG
jgi:hypothetical protein